MEIGAVSGTRSADALAAAWAAVAAASVEGSQAGEVAGALPGRVAEGVRPAAGAALPEATSQLPEPADAAPRAANAQSVARPHVPLVEPLREADEALPRATHAGSEFALPADQLVQVLLTGLQVEAAAAWPLLRRSAEETPPPRPRPDDERPRERPRDESPAKTAEPDEEPPQEAAVPLPEPPRLDDPREADWSAPLARALRAALAGKIPPRALIVAAEQWQRGRCVVLACPQGEDAAGPAWAFVLWPRRPITRTRPPALQGLRVDARLLWTVPPRGAQWCHVRVVKEHHPSRGRQLVAMDASGAANGSGVLPLEVQLGPVLARSLRGCEVCLRIDAVRRFWTALGAQWSASVVVCSTPLVPAAGPTIVEATR